MRANASLLAVLLIAGCDSVNVQQYRIAAASRGDRGKVKAVLRSIATQLSLENRTFMSRAPDTLVFYKEPNVEHFAVELCARGVGSDILVDLDAGFGPRPRKYVEAGRLLASGLETEFGSRATLVEHPDTIRHSTPQSLTN